MLWSASRWWYYPHMPDLLAVLALLSSIAAALVAGAAWKAALASAPAQLSRAVSEMRQSVEQYALADEGRDVRMVAWRAELEAVLETVENLVETTERKRRQTAAAASRLEKGENGVATDYDSVVSRFRGMGLDV